MQFLHSPLTWGFFLVLVPLLIHLINLMRQRRIEWAAMEFLLAAYKKQRKWIWLKQLLLLLARMLVIALVVAMLAKLVTQQQWLSRRLGGRPIHHIVLLDDSLSMSDRDTAATVFDLATQAVGRLAAHLSQQAAEGSGTARFSVVRFSRAARTAQADISMAPVDKGLPALWENKRVALDVSELAVDPLSALDMAKRVVEQRPDDRHVVYLFSDFRRTNWEEPAEIRARIAELEELQAQVNLVRCVEESRPNLAITSLAPAAGTIAAGVPLFADISVRNFGTQPAEQVVVTVRSASYPPRPPSVSASGQFAGGIAPDREELPGIAIDRIGPGETVQRRVQVYFPNPGDHYVEAELPADAVASDNRRWCVISLPPDIPVLVIDDDPTQRNAMYMTSVFRPSDLVETGVRPEVQPLSFLRDASPETLAAYRAIYLLDIAQLDDRATSNLEQYARDGGGVGIFLGPQSSRDFLTQWHKDGQGLLPVAVDRMELLELSNDNTPDLEVTDHPLFGFLRGDRNPFLRGILIRQYYRVKRDWKPNEDSRTRVLARLRNGDPLVVERQFGEGRVVTVMTTVTPSWNNWATGPTFVVFILELQSYLHAADRLPLDRLVGTTIPIQLDVARYLPDVAFTLPADDNNDRQVVRLQAERQQETSSNVLSVELGKTGPQAIGDTVTSGVYEAWSHSLDGEFVAKRLALNIDTRESSMSLAQPDQLASGLGDNVALFTINDVTLGAPDDRRLPLSQYLMFALVGLLLGEQWLSYSASYHPPRRSGR